MSLFAGERLVVWDRFDKIDSQLFCDLGKQHRTFMCKKLGLNIPDCFLLLLIFFTHYAVPITFGLSLMFA